MAVMARALELFGPPSVLGNVLVLICGIWLEAVNENVKEPYMDEIFHIPQAQQYCRGDYITWDQMITTPPGLYYFSILQNVLNPSNWFAKPRHVPYDRRLFRDVEGVKTAELLHGQTNCGIADLRAIGVFTLVLFFVVCWALRVKIWNQRVTETSFPPGNGTTVGKAPAAAAEQNTSSKPSSSIAALTALNICLFPPLFFFSALYYTDVLSTFVVIFAYLVFSWREESKSGLRSGVLVYLIGIVALFMRQTNVFWMGVLLAGLEWVRTCEAVAPQTQTSVFSFGRISMTGVKAMYKRFAAGDLHNPPLADASIFDLALSLVSLAISALHHPILLVSNLWPYISLLATFTAFVIYNGGVVLGDKSNHVATIHTPQLLYFAAFITFFSYPVFLPAIVRLAGNINTLTLPAWTTMLGLVIAQVAALAMVRFNTLVHPFTLADNRHYMFYVFNKILLRYRIARYAITPIYVLGGSLAVRTLGGEPSVPALPSNGIALNGGAAAKAKPVAPGAATGPSTAFTLLLAITTALSLVTAPLVEPRYFILPWVMWRLHIPPATTSQGIKAEKIALVGELLWSLAIIAVTCGVFIHKPFEWKSEPGKLQRFMW